MGAIWTVSGALMAFNPPPEGYRASRRMPFVGLVTLVGGIYIAFKALRSEDVEDSGYPPRHASGEETSVRRALLLVLGVPVGVAGGASFIWWGINSGLLSVLGLGLATFTLSVLVIPQAIPVLKWLLHRLRP